jgi:biotin carboxylase
LGNAERKNMKKILVINLGWEQEPLLDALENYDVDIYGIHYDSSFYKKPKYRDVFITDLRDLETILKYAESIKPDAVISDECDYSHFAQAVVAETLGLPGPSIENAQISSNKYLQRKKAKENGVLVPEFRLCISKEDILEFGKEVGYPIIVKPIDNRGSFGVNKISSADEVENSYIDSLLNSHSRLVIVEKFIDGTHITVDGYIFENKIKAVAVASKDKLKDKDYLIDEDIIYPANFSRKIYDKAIKNAEFTASKLAFKFGFIHGEFIVDKDANIYLTEMANRGGGVYTSTLIMKNYTGIDFVNIYIRDVLGEKQKFNSSIKEKFTELKFFQFSTEKKGIINSIKGIEKLEDSKNILKIKLLVKKGDSIGSVTNGAERHGLAIISANTKEELTKTLNQISNTLKVEIE